ncbi:Tetraspanin-11 [Mactra antiquata]
MGCFDGLARFLLVVLNSVFLLGGLAITAVGIILRYGKVLYEPFLETGIHLLEQTLANTGLAVLNVEDINLGEVMTSIALGLIFGGLALTVLSFLGCCGACCKVGFVLWLYAIVIIVFFIGEAIAIGLLYGKPEIITNELKASLVDYKGVASDEVYSVAWNIIMIQFQCCGVDSYRDFDISTSWNKSPVASVNLVTPVACCKTLPTEHDPKEFKCATTYDPSINNGESGCFQTVWDASMADTRMVVPILVACGIFQLAFIVFAIQVARSEDRSSSGVI